ncbi:MAG: hypothetical protein IJM76_05880 [Lachnospiraceae bacterium]|nr:hypothetical protein [Lachnospiraceae bacterium]
MARHCEGRDTFRGGGWHENAKLHVTDGGSTIAIDNGDIVSVCKKPGDGISGRGIIEYAVKNGGNKLDSYEGNHGFYTKCGFEPVSWCKWDDEYAGSAVEQGWDPDRDRKEDIIFYRYVGAGNVKYDGGKGLEEFKKEVPASLDYDSAYTERDKKMGA